MTAEFTETSARRLGPVRRFLLRRPVAMDIVVMLVFAVPWGLNFVAGPPTGPAGERWPVSLALIVLGTVALVWRRRRPVEVLAVMVVLAVAHTALLGTISGFDVGAALALYAVAAHRPTATTWVAFGGTAVVAGTAIWLWESGSAQVTVTDSGGTPVPVDELPTDQVRAFVIASTLILLLLAVTIGISVRNRRLHLAAMLDRANALVRDRATQATMARAAERSRIAREMHDVVAHSLSVMIALADGAGAALDRSPDRARVALDELSDTGRTALADVRRVLGVLTEDEAPATGRAVEVATAPQPSSTDLDALVQRFRSAGLPVRLTRSGPDLPTDAGLRLTVYRIAQESLTNVLRHAPGTSRVDLAVTTTAAGVELEVLDHGPATEPGDPGGAGRGLVGMRERVAVYGGTLTAGPWSGGWRVHAVLPWREGTR